MLKKSDKINWTKTNDLLIMPSKEEMCGSCSLETHMQSLQKCVILSGNDDVCVCEQMFCHLKFKKNKFLSTTNTFMSKKRIPTKS